MIMSVYLVVVITLNTTDQQVKSSNVNDKNTKTNVDSNRSNDSNSTSTIIAMTVVVTE